MTKVSLRLSLFSAKTERKMAVLHCLACAGYSLRRRRYLILFVSYIVVHKKTFILVMFRVLGLSARE